MIRPQRGLVLLLCSLFVAANAMAAPDAASKTELLPAQVSNDTLAAIFSGDETLHYSVSWSGGVKIGDIYMQIRPESSRAQAHVISARVKDYGPLSVIYPVDDTFRCFVGGTMKLPYRYEVEQKEGYGRETSRLTMYDQDQLLVRYQKNKEPQQKFPISGTVYNEFASFIITRALTFKDGRHVVVPTFADKKRHEVRVSMTKQEQKMTVFGKLNTLKVQPRMQFKGLYEKSGDTIVWLTDDRCRVPVEIHSKIVVGSLVAELVEYSNSACPELRPKQRVQPRE